MNMALSSLLQASLIMLFRLSLYLTVVCTLSSFAQGRPLTVKNCGKRFLPFSKIVGGTSSIPGEYPWMVSLQQNYNGSFDHVCGASILNENYIITAAHCIDVPINPDDYEVVVGLYSLSNEDKKPVKVHKIEEVIMHSGFNEDLENDIALLRTAEPIKIKESYGFVNGICLPDNQKDPKGFATVTGWGDTKEGGNNSDILLAVRVPIVRRDLCSKSYTASDHSMEIPDTQICAGLIGKDSCQSDSGGPLIQKNKEGAYTLIGIVSYGIGCGQRRYPGVYTKVSMYEDWIEDRMMGKPQTEPPMVVTTTEGYTTTTLVPQKNKTFSKLLMYSSNFQSKLIFMSQK